MATEENDDLYNFNREYPAGRNFMDPTTMIGGYPEELGPSYTYGVAPPRGGASRQGPASRAGGNLGGRVSQAGRVGTATGRGEQKRPMSSVGAAGYSSAAPRPGTTLNAGANFESAAKPPVPLLRKKEDGGAEEKAKEMEKQLSALLDESAALAKKGEFRKALEKAREASRKDLALQKHREAHGLLEQSNLDLTYYAAFTHAVMFEANGLWDEALAAYKKIASNKQYPGVGRLRVNMGNIYMKKREYKEALRQYKMALDQVQTHNRELRFKIMRNIGIALVKQEALNEAVRAFEMIMESMPDFKTGLNLIVCYYTLGEKDKMKQTFVRMVQAHAAWLKERGEEPGDPDEDDADTADGVAVSTPAAVGSEGTSKKPLVLNDPLKQELRERQKRMDRSLLMAANLIAPVIEKDDDQGFSWVVETLRKSGFASLANELEMAKALSFLQKRNYEHAIDTLKAFEKREGALAASAATNLSFVYFLEGEVKQAETHAETAIQADRYNAKALVNKGNCVFMNGDYEQAKDIYLEALGVEADCVEAIYNLGLVYTKQGLLDKALKSFVKLQSIIPNSPEVLYQIASLYDALGDHKPAMDWFKRLAQLVPTDPGVQRRLAELCEKENDEFSAFQYNSEALRLFPGDMDTVVRQGKYFLRRDDFNNALKAFKLAVRLQPETLQYHCLVASCYRRLQKWKKAYEWYKEVHSKAPTDPDVVRMLASVAANLGLDEERREYEALVVRLQAEQDRRHDEQLRQEAQAKGSEGITTPPAQQYSRIRESTSRQASGANRPTSSWAPSSSDWGGEADENMLPI